MDDKEIYHSDVISPGYKLETDQLSKKLDSGTYPCTAYFCVLNEDGSEYNRIGLEITLEKQ